VTVSRSPSDLPSLGLWTQSCMTTVQCITCCALPSIRWQSRSHCWCLSCITLQYPTQKQLKGKQVGTVIMYIVIYLNKSWFYLVPSY
jgi:hypothetical protein